MDENFSKGIALGLTGGGTALLAMELWPVLRDPAKRFAVDPDPEDERRQRPFEAIVTFGVTMTAIGLAVYYTAKAAVSLYETGELPQEFTE